MIYIEIDDYNHPYNPLDCSTPKNQLEVFLEGFKQLCNKTGMHKVDLCELKDNFYVPAQLVFDDGSTIGLKRLFKETGFE